MKTLGCVKTTIINFNLNNSIISELNMYVYKNEDAVCAFECSVCFYPTLCCCPVNTFIYIFVLEF